MNVLPRERGSIASPIPLCFPFLLPSPRLHLIFLNAPFGLKPKEQASCSLLYSLLNLSNTDYGAKCYTRAECNTIL
jgi:hypothetical protein